MMHAPRFLSLDDVLQIHRNQIELYGGDSAIRDPGLLASAVAQPQGVFEGRYLHRDLFEMAAAYLFHIVRNHPFVDGNKRAGAAAALVFLDLNGVDVRAEEQGLLDLTMAVAQGQATKAQVAEFLQSIAC